MLAYLCSQFNFMRLLTFLLVICLFGSCNNHNTKPEVLTPSINPEKNARESFFPVTNYLKGQLTEIKNGGVNPLKFTTSHAKTDSMWLKMEDLTNEAAPFLEPVIDTANISHLFREFSRRKASCSLFTIVNSIRWIRLTSSAVL